MRKKNEMKAVELINDKNEESVRNLITKRQNN
jgi:hypothetical protein